MSKINYFNGGLSLKASYFLLKENEAVVAINTDVNSGNLKPLKQDVNTGISISNYFKLFKNSWYSNSTATGYAIYNDYILMDNTAGTKYAKYYNSTMGTNVLGMWTPEHAPILMPTIEVNPFDTAYVVPMLSRTFSGTALRSYYNVTHYIYLYSSFGAAPYIMPWTSYGPVVGDIIFTLSSLPPEYSDWGVYRYFDQVPVNGSVQVYSVYRGTELTATADNLLAEDLVVVTLPFTLYEYALRYNLEDYLVVKTVNGVKKVCKFSYNPPPSSFSTEGVLFVAIPDVDNATLYRYTTGNPYGNNLIGYKKCPRVIYTSPEDGSKWVIDDGTLLEEIYADYTNNNKEFSYVVTQYIDYNGWESPPSPVATTTLTNVMVILSGGVTTPGMSHYKIYRMGGNYSEYMLVAKLPVGTDVYIDNTFSEAGAVLTSQLNSRPPLAITHLTEMNSMIFGSVDNKLYFSDIAYFWSWSPYNYLQFADTITGIAKSPNGLLVYTLNETYMVTGTTPQTLSKFLINSQYGCVEHNTISYIDNSVIWLSLDGICVSDGGTINLITKDKIKSFTLTGPYTSIVYNGTYYLGYSEGTLCLNLSPFSLYVVDIITTCFGIKDNELYYSKNGTLYKAFSSTTPRSLTYKSPSYTDGGIGLLKNYNNIYAYSTGTLTLVVYIDQVKVITQTLNSGFTDVAIPQEHRLGYSIQFEVTGTGELHEIEYKLEGRQNGR